MRDLDFHSSTLPRGTFARSIFDNHLIRLSDRGGASQLIGSAWSDAAARELNGWIGGSVPGSAADLSQMKVTTVHRLDLLPGVAARASRVGLKNPDFIVFGTCDSASLVFGVDAKFSVETATQVQVSAETVSQLFEADEHLARMLPAVEPGARFVDGLFVIPDYSLTHAMFRHKIGHRRLTVSPRDVVLTDVNGGGLFRRVTSEPVIERLIGIDQTAFPVWESLLATQYYFRLERAIVGLVAESQKPLLGSSDIDASETDLIGEIEKRDAEPESAWQLVLDWDKEMDQLRRQRQALSQVVGAPLSNAELRELSDTIMDELGVEERPSRNRVRKALGGRFMGDVLDRVGVIVPPVEDFSAELERVAAVSREINAAYIDDMPAILTEIINDLVQDGGK